MKMALEFQNPECPSIFYSLVRLASTNQLHLHIAHYQEEIDYL